MSYRSLPESVAALEEEILAKWREEETFKRSMECRDGAPEFVFYEGPPTANGRPGVHHTAFRSRLRLKSNSVSQASRTSIDSESPSSMQSAVRTCSPTRKTGSGCLSGSDTGWTMTGHTSPVLLNTSNQFGGRSEKSSKRDSFTWGTRFFRTAPGVEQDCPVTKWPRGMPIGRILQ